MASALYLVLLVSHPQQLISKALFRKQLMWLSRSLKDKRVHYYSKNDKIIVLYDNARSRCGVSHNL